MVRALFLTSFNLSHLLKCPISSAGGMGQVLGLQHMNLGGTQFSSQQ